MLVHSRCRHGRDETKTSTGANFASWCGMVSPLATYWFQRAWREHGPEGENLGAEVRGCHVHNARNQIEVRAACTGIFNSANGLALTPRSRKPPYPLQDERQEVSARSAYRKPSTPAGGLLWRKEAPSGCDGGFKSSSGRVKTENQ